MSSSDIAISTRDFAGSPMLARKAETHSAVADASTSTHQGSKSTSPATADKRRMTIVDGLRGIAAMAVVICHTLGILIVGVPASIRPKITVIGDWGHGVDIFFVLSGFVIAHSIGNRLVDWRYIWAFILRRSIRLDPPYWCAIAVGLATMVIRNRFGHAAGDWPTVWGFFLHFAYLEDLFHQPRIVPVFWTLCLEVQLYLVFVLLLGIAHWVHRPKLDAQSRDQFTVKVIFFAYIISFAWAVGFFKDNWITPWFVYPWHKFLLGAIISLLATRRIKLRTAMSAILIYVTVGVIRRWTVGSPEPRFSSGIWIACATATFLACGVARGALYSWLSWRPLLWLGSISYSLYLLHEPIIEILMAAQTRVAGKSWSASLVFFCLAIVLSLSAAWILYILVERPSVRLASRLTKGLMQPRSQKQTPAAPLELQIAH
jgi:peptidoglycan/LPS O-acetylase OafA/YrhL